MDSFFTGANLTWIIGIISSIAAGLSALSKFRYQNKLELFKETNVNIFKQEKEEVLAAISTMSVFKKDSRFEKHTTNVLLSRLYRELDYDITNAICGALIQYSNRRKPNCLHRSAGLILTSWKRLLPKNIFWIA